MSDCNIKVTPRQPTVKFTPKILQVTTMPNQPSVVFDINCGIS